MSLQEKLDRSQVFPESELPRGTDLLAQGRKLAQTWQVEKNAFLQHYAVASEFDYKQDLAANGRVMQHAQIGFRDPERTREAYRTIWEKCADRNVTLDRYGICLDWSMAVPRDKRASATRGTGMILPDAESAARLSASAPVAPHFGDFVLGFPAAIENTQMALAAGCTAIGNFGQYFSFRVPNWDDDIETTHATLTALGMLAAQPQPILIHSNIDDGYAAQFTDLTSSLGMMEIERDIVEGLIGARMSHCFGHHFSNPVTRLAFQRALARRTSTPGSMIYGNTTSYRGTVAENYAALARYLSVDALGQTLNPTGHAINAVPVTENERIPDIDEIVDAQLFAGRLIELTDRETPLIDTQQVDEITDRLVDGAVRFKANVTRGFNEAGIDTTDAFEMMLSLRRIGARKLEQWFGVGPLDASKIGGRAPLVPGSVLEEIEEMADVAMEATAAADASHVRQQNLRILVATTDVHEHGKLLIEELLRRLDVELIDGGVSTDAGTLVERAAEHKPDVIALSTYNGVALSYFCEVKRLMEENTLDIPLLIGGRLNQIPEDSNSGLPVDVGSQLEKAGALVCRNASTAVKTLAALGQSPQIKRREPGSTSD